MEKAFDYSYYTPLKIQFKNISLAPFHKTKLRKSLPINERKIKPPVGNEWGVRKSE